MTALRAAAQQALEALEFFRDTAMCSADTDTANEVIPALRAALAEPVQEPVAWMVYTEGGTSAYVTDNPNDLIGAYRALPLYTAPPQRKPLTEEELDELAMDEDGLPNSHLEFARAIERAHEIGEQQ